MSNKILDPPEGCLEIPGVIIVIEPGKRWMTQNGFITDIFGERGVWATEKDADNARDKFCV